MERADLAAIVERVPELRATAEAVASLRSTADALPINPFVEPFTLVADEEKESGKRQKQLMGVGARDLRSWSRHIAYSVRVRLRSIESAVVYDVSRGRLLAAAVLLRSHLEAAALAVYCAETLTRCAQSSSIGDLTELMHKTLFGTSLAKHADRKEWVAELVSVAETNTIQICRAIEALDRYLCQDAASGEMGVFYGLLCEFAHPNHRGVMSFKKAEPTEEGWTIRYVLDEPFDAQMANRLLDYLLESMQAGYSASEMLRAWDFNDGKDGIEWIWPSLETANDVWTTLVQRDL